MLKQLKTIEISKEKELYSNVEKSIKIDIDKNNMDFILTRLTDLYKDPLTSTIRELMSNAIDTTIEAKSNKAIEVTLPTMLSPVLHIRDYGVGMDIEDLENIYTKYGNSSKRNDIDQIGSFGLGAKSPLSYTSSFTIETVKNKTKIIGVVSRTEKGIYLNIFSQLKTEEENGTKISIPILEKDMLVVEKVFKIYKDRENTISIPINILNFINYNEKYNDYTFEKLDEFIIDDMPFELYGYISKNKYERLNVYEYFSTCSNQNIELSLLLEGWDYSLSKRTHNFRYKIYVKAPKNIVDFIPSREEILTNERKELLLTKIYKYFEDLPITNEYLYKEEIDSIIKSLSKFNYYKNYNINNHRFYHNIIAKYIENNDTDVVQQLRHKPLNLYTQNVDELDILGALRYDYSYSYLNDKFVDKKITSTPFSLNKESKIFSIVNLMHKKSLQCESLENAIIVVTNSNNKDRDKILTYRKKINNNLSKIFFDYCILITTLTEEKFKEKYGNIIQNKIIYCNSKEIFDNSFLIKKEEDKILKVKLNNMRIENITEIDDIFNADSIIVNCNVNANIEDIQKYINYLKYFKNINVDEIYFTNKNIDNTKNKNVFYTIDYIRFFTKKELNKYNLPLWIQNLQANEIKILSGFCKDKITEFMNSNLMLYLNDNELQELENNNIFYLYFFNRIQHACLSYLEDKTYIEPIIKEKYPKLYEIILNTNKQKHVNYLLLNSNSFLQFLISIKNEKLWIEMEQTIYEIESLYYAKLTRIASHLFSSEQDRRNKIRLMYELLMKDLNFDEKVENILNKKGEK